MESQKVLGSEIEQRKIFGLAGVCSGWLYDTITIGLEAKTQDAICSPRVHTSHALQFDNSQV